MKAQHLHCLSSPLAGFCRNIRASVLLSLLFLLLLLAQGAAASQAVNETVQVGNDAQMPVNLSHAFAILEDPGKKLGLQDVMRPDAPFKADQSGGEALNLGYTRSAMWLRLHLSNNTSQNVKRMLEIGASSLASLQWYYPDASGQYQVHTTGSMLSYDSRAYPNRQFVFPLTLPAFSEQVFYLRVLSTPAMQLPIQLWDVEGFYRHERNDYIMQAAYFGMVMAMVFFNLLLFIALRDKLYLLYVNFVLCLALTLALQNGLLTEFFWPRAGEVAVIVRGCGYAVSLISMIIFMRKMLDTHKVVPRIDRLLKAMVWILLVSILCYVNWYQDFIKFAAQINTVMVICLFFVGLYCAWQRERPAILFLAAFMVLLLGAMLNGFRALGLVPVNAFTINALQVGSMVEMLVLAFALADRFYVIMRDKDQAQKEALGSQQRLLETLQSAERMLEVKVQQRTHALNESHQALRETHAAMSGAVEAAEHSRQQALAAEQQAKQAMQEFQAAQNQLVQAEKMAALGQLIAGVAHEINAPIQQVKESGKKIAESVEQVLQAVPNLFLHLNAAQRTLFIKLVNRANQVAPLAGKREVQTAGAEYAALLAQLREMDIAQPEQVATILTQLRVQNLVTEIAELLQLPDCMLLLNTAAAVVTTTNSTQEINKAVDKVATTIHALKSYSHFDPEQVWRAFSLQSGVDTVLTLFQNQLSQGIVLQRHYSHVPNLHGLPDELNQVWTNILQNAIQAMPNGGILSISITRDDTHAHVAIADTGSGIAPEIQQKIFDPFFTTREQGQGLGLGIAEKIIAKHHGNIQIHSAPDEGTTVIVTLPLISPVQDCGGSVAT